MDLLEPAAERFEFAEDVELWEIERFLAGRFFHAFLGALESVLVGAIEVEAVVDATDDSGAVLVPDAEQTLLRQVTFARLHHLIGHLCLHAPSSLRQSTPPILLKPYA